MKLKMKSKPLTHMSTDITNIFATNYDITVISEYYGYQQHISLWRKINFCLL